MNNLDDVSIIKKADRNDMLGMISGRPRHIMESFDIVRKEKLKGTRPDSIVVCGMGGSALPSTLLRAWLTGKSRTSFTIWRDYGLPLVSGKNPLIFAISYSGNTEETLDAAESAFGGDCRMVGISSGGKLSRFCNKNGIPLLKVPTGLQPRAASGYIFALQALALERLNVCRITPELLDCVSVLKKMLPRLSTGFVSRYNVSKHIALQIYDSVPVIYGSGIISPVARYWQVFFNENSKILAWSGEFPEMNHNETVGWYGDSRCNEYTPVLLRDSQEYGRIKKRIELTKKLAFGNANRVIEVWPEGRSELARMFSTLWIGEFASIYIACLRNVDPSSIPVIDELKKQMKDR